MVLQQPLGKRTYIYNCKLVANPDKKPFYSFYLQLGKGCGIISCKCFNMRHDLTKLQWIERATWSLISDMWNGVRRYSMILKEYGDPKPEQWIVLESEKRYLKASKKYVPIDNSPNAPKVSGNVQKHPKKPIVDEPKQELVDVNAEFDKENEQDNSEIGDWQSVAE